MGNETPQITGNTSSAGWSAFKFQIDENTGFYEDSKTSDNIFTNNTFLRFFWQPKPLLNKNIGFIPLNISAWFRTTDSDPDKSKTIARIFGGPTAYVRLVDNDAVRLQITESPNIFWGKDLNEPPAKDWQSWEFGNYASAELTYKPAGLSLDFHNWYVRGLDVTVAGDKSAKEDGFILGTTLTWSPFAVWPTNTILDSLSFYVRFREWAWQVEPEGKDVERQWWPEFTSGLKLDLTIGS